MKYAKVYETDNAIVRIITPEQRLGRPMTQEEKDKINKEVMKDVLAANIAIIKSLHNNKLKGPS